MQQLIARNFWNTRSCVRPVAAVVGLGRAAIAVVSMEGLGQNFFSKHLRSNRSIKWQCAVIKGYFISQV